MCAKKRFLILENVTSLTGTNKPGELLLLIEFNNHRIVRTIDALIRLDAGVSEPRCNADVWVIPNFYYTSA